MPLNLHKHDKREGFCKVTHGALPFLIAGEIHFTKRASFDRPKSEHRKNKIDPSTPITISAIPMPRIASASLERKSSFRIQTMQYCDKRFSFSDSPDLVEPPPASHANPQCAPVIDDRDPYLQPSAVFPKLQKYMAENECPDFRSTHPPNP